ncbi:hypothetical protein AABB24_012469, partial [Solanum stoloniferum]
FCPHITFTLPFHLLQRSPQRSSFFFQKLDASSSSPITAHGIPHVLPHSLRQRNGSGPPKKCSINHSSSQIDLKRSILERFGHPLHYFTSVSSEVCVSKNSNFEFLEPNLGYKRTLVLIKIIKESTEKVHQRTKDLSINEIIE